MQKSNLKVRNMIPREGFLMKPSYAYLHGFLSGPSSSKGRHLAGQFQRFGVELTRLDLNGADGPPGLTHEGAFAAVDAFWHTHSSPLRLVGSSFGGWAAAAYAERHPERVDRLLLLCPGFGLADRLQDVIGGPEAMSRWEVDGERTFAMPSSGATMCIPWKFAATARQQPAFPQPQCRTLVIHGQDDEGAPFRHWPCAHPG